jgi:hypothetical protein
VTFTVKSRGDRSATIVCVYTCPEHGAFDAEVHRDENGDSPDEVKCQHWLAQEETEAGGYQWHGSPTLFCGKWSTWTPVPIAGHVRRVEVSRGKYEKPERKTYLDTRKLGEGQDPDEFRAERKKIWTEKRREKVKDLLR